ncbi:uncharacterized protein LOC136069993 [Quercus suber]|uniref:uncharacterized protein LOC136069993 n=1 Tax=Quercus suber TaxID=58331 RepID=UPI0032DF187F
MGLYQVAHSLKFFLFRLLLQRRITIEDVKKYQWCKKKLKRKQPEATQVTKENPRLSLQSDEEIEKIVDEAKICPLENATIGMEEDVEFEDVESEDEAIGMEEDIESEDEQEDEN